MWKLKACPRCGGDVFIDKGLDSWYEECLQCGYQRELRNLREIGVESPQREREPVLASRRGRPAKK